MKNITFSADEHLIETAREKALLQSTTLNEQFRLWLKNYANEDAKVKRHQEVLHRLKGKLKVGGKLTRDEMNER